MMKIIHAWISVASLIGSVIAVVSLLVAVSGQRKQFAIQIMLQYSERFRSLLGSAPVELLNTSLQRDLPEMNTEVTRHVFQVLFMLVELHYLREKRYLSGSIWALWISDVERMLRSPLMRREWPVKRIEFEGHRSFCQFVDSVQGRCDAQGLSRKLFPHDASP